VLVLATVSVLAACGSDRSSSGTATPQTQPALTVPHETLPIVPGTEPQVTPPSFVVPDTHGPPLGTTAGGSEAVNGTVDPGLQPYIDMATSDLAQRLSIDGDQIAVVSAELKTWPDSSLGCPQPGMQYAQVMTDGALIVLRAAAKEYRYHAGGSRPPFLCES
jgi:hypothetical protein